MGEVERNLCCIFCNWLSLQNPTILSPPFLILFSTPFTLYSRPCVVRADYQPLTGGQASARVRLTRKWRSLQNLATVSKPTEIEVYAACPEGTQANTKEKRISLTCAHCWFYGLIQLLLLNTLRERCLQNVASLIILGLELFAGHRTLAQLPNVLLEKWKRKNMQRICIQCMQ